MINTQISSSTASLYFCQLVAALLLLFTILPLLPLGYWWIRILDFPRVQILVLSLLLFMIILFQGGSFSGNNKIILLTAIIVVIGYQSYCIAPYTRLFAVEVESKHGAGISLNVLTVNLEYENTEYDAFLEIIKKTPTDLLVLSELNSDWHTALSPLYEDFPYYIQEVREDGHGIGLLSKYPLEQEAVRFLVSELRPSIFAELVLPNNQRVSIWGVHPAPPGILIDSGERKSSRPRDAELLLVADQVAKSKSPALVLGDFNDTAWSRTTSLFKAKSGLLDPRRGRGLYNTYHAEYSLLRYPIDHVFVSHHFTLSKLDRLASFGSDHFPMFATLHLHAKLTRGSRQPENQAVDTSEVIEEGKELAEQYEEHEEVG